MSYFDTLQGYMGNMKESQDHEASMVSEQQDKKAQGIQEKFEAISQQASGWGGAVTATGLAFKWGLKVYKGGGTGTGGAGSTTTTTTTSSVKPTGAGESSTSEADLGAGAGGDAGAGAGAGSASSTSIRVSKGKGRAKTNEDGSPQAPADAEDLANAGIKPPLQDATQFQSNTSENIARVIAPKPKGSAGTAGDGAGGGAGGDAGDLASNAGKTTRTLANTGDDLASMGEDVANVASRTITTAVNTVAQIGEKVATGVADAIPVIGEVVGIGTMIGGLIHGLHKGGLQSKLAGIASDTSTVARGAIDTGALKGAQTIQGQIRA